MSVSYFIRNFHIPNPFESFQYGVFYNLLADIVLYPFTFIIVGMFYEKRSNPALGSLLYLLFYCVHVGLLFVFSYLDWSRPSILIILVGYIVLISAIAIFKNYSRGHML